MAHLTAGSSSSSSTTRNHKYDVFLSFRGLDTRNRFTAYLYEALVGAKYNTFLDNKEIETGDYLKLELEVAIESSRASIIIVSNNYASSTWCLDELVLILDQRTNSKQLVIPIFYDIDPTDVRKQQKSFGEAMEKHKQRMEAETDAEKRRDWADKMKSWENALTTVAGLKGIDANGRMEPKLIEEIVEVIYGRLGLPLGTTTPPQLIGMENHIQRITSWLKDGSDHTADVLSICGMSGIGKTSLADYIYKSHHCEFTSSSFVRDINKRCAQGSHGLLSVQKQLCDAISKTSLFQVYDVSEYTSIIEKSLAHEKVLIVLDDVDSLDQLDALLGSKGFHSGSKIIITTQDASLVERSALFKTQNKSKHTYTECNLKGLSDYASLELLCRHAFACNYPNEGYKEVSRNIAQYFDGHPLALEAVGKSLYNRDVAYWEDLMRVLNKERLSGLEKVKRALRTRFDSLQFENDRELFKHIACFFVGKDRDVVETILKSCDFNTKIGITNLIDRCFLSIGWNNELMMHSFYQEIGRDIVRQESPKKPWERSRLWCDEESFRVLKEKKGTDNLLGLTLDMTTLYEKELPGSFELETDSLSGMDNLMLLQLSYVQLNGFFTDVPENLRWLCMHGFPLKSLDLDIPMEKLVALDMSCSNIESFGVPYSNPQPCAQRQMGLIRSSSKDKQLHRPLKILDLSFCEQLHSLGGFSKFPALERLTVRKCVSLIDLCESVEKCVDLVHIDLSYCNKLKKCPTFSKLKKLETLLLDSIRMSYVIINSQPCSSAIVEVIPSDSKFFTISLPNSLRRLSLAHNNLSNESFRVDSNDLPMLEELCLDDNPIVSMPSFVSSLPKLEKLSMNFCDKLVSIERPPSTLAALFFGSVGYRSFVRKLKFNPGMSGITLRGDHYPCEIAPVELDGILKIQVMADIEEKLLHSLGWSWTNFEFIKAMHFQIHNKRRHRIQAQVYYEFGIFSTFYFGKEMPEWIKCRSKGPSISFTIPSSPNKLRGLNICSVETRPRLTFALPMIKISNITKNLTWIYYNAITFGKGSCSVLLSHWMFGPNEMEGGDRITITLAHRFVFKRSQVTEECGIGLVYDNIERKEEKDVLGSYKSWNHIIGGDLSPFRLTTGEYFLSYREFMRTSSRSPRDYYYNPSIDHDARYTDEVVSFKAFRNNDVDADKNEDRDRDRDEEMRIMARMERARKMRMMPFTKKML